MHLRLITSVLLLAMIFFMEGIFPHFRGRRSRARHAFPNIILAGLSGIISGVLFAPLTVGAINWAQSNSFGLVHIIKMPLYIRGIVAFILFDLSMYLWHLINHRVLFLWRFHRVHHSDLEMDSTTALRFHPGETIFSSLLRLIIIPFIGMNYLHLLVYQMSLQAVILFHHSNIRVPEKWDRVFRSCIVTPNMHRVHHSREWHETNSNYASIFSLWDRLNRTFRERGDTLTIIFGLNMLREAKWQSLWGMLRTPLR